MRRNETIIKKHVMEFFQNSGIECGVNISEQLVIQVEIANAESSHTFKFPNRFNDSGDDWSSLDKLLEEELKIWKHK
jgi:hypothetical protein